MARRVTKATRASAPGQRQALERRPAAARRAMEPGPGNAGAPGATLWAGPGGANAPATPMGTVRVGGGPARPATTAVGRRAPAGIPPTQRLIARQAVAAIRPLDLEDEMTYIRGDIRRMIVVSGALFLLLILMSFFLA